MAKYSVIVSADAPAYAEVIVEAGSHKEAVKTAIAFAKQEQHKMMTRWRLDSQLLNQEIYIDNSEEDVFLLPPAESEGLHVDATAPGQSGS